MAEPRTFGQSNSVYNLAPASPEEQMFYPNVGTSNILLFNSSNITGMQWLPSP